jgi:hypothetical protein
MHFLFKTPANNSNDLENSKKLLKSLDYEANEGNSLFRVNYITNTDTTLKLHIQTEVHHKLFGTQCVVMGHAFKSNALNQPLRGFILKDILELLNPQDFANTIHFLIEAGTIDKQKTLIKRAEKIADKFNFKLVKKIPIANSRSFYLEYTKDF